METKVGYEQLTETKEHTAGCGGKCEPSHVRLAGCGEV
jgi:hypothetical protein